MLSEYNRKMAIEKSNGVQIKKEEHSEIVEPTKTLSEEQPIVEETVVPKRKTDAEKLKKKD